MTKPLPPPGWYADPSGAASQRYFDGANWTDYSAPYAPTPLPPPIPKPSGGGRTVAIVLGIVGIVLVGFVVLIGIAMFTGSHSSSPSGSSAPPGGNLFDRSVGMNQPAADGKFTFTVTGFDEMDSIGLSNPRGRFIVVNVTVKNTSNKEQSFQVNDQMLIGSNGAKYRADWVAASSINHENTLLLELGPGFTADYRLPFDLPQDVAPAKVELHESALSGGAKVKLS
jgi:Domain of unknown function (DUF4352)/Protein of unknown function (DUF2510)